MEQKPLKIYTASAGSGKTYTLVRDFLALALQGDPRSYQSIQAVTFTKKATAEMKERILEELHKLYQGEEQSMEQALLQVYKEQGIVLRAQTLRKRAGATLRILLQEYRQLRVRTIDSFFQEILRSFAYELGHSGAMHLEMDTKYARHYAVQALFADLDQGRADKNFSDWVKRLAQDELEEGSSMRIEKQIIDFAAELERESVKEMLIAGTFPSTAEIEALEKALKAYQSVLKQEIQRLTSNGMLRIIEQKKIDTSEFKYGASGALSPVIKIARSKEALLTDAQGKGIHQAIRWHKFVDSGYSPEELFSSKCDAPDQLNGTDFYQYAREFEELCQEEASSSMVAKAILDQLSFYKLLSKIKDKLDDLRRSERLSLLSDAPTLIASLLKHIDQGQAPFFYEKIGTRVLHHMIDEFQDTSQMQYNNFRPLLSESLAQGAASLIVGDAKQSIYRFRNADSRLIGSLEKEFEGSTEHKPLNTNWRSCPEIVHFNNELYPKLAPLLRATLCDDLSASTDKALQDLLDEKGGIYEAAQMQQEVAPNKRDKHGVLVLHDYPLPTKPTKDKRGAEQQKSEQDSEQKDGDADLTKEQQAIERYRPLIPVIFDLERRGYRPTDIAILVRGKREAQAIALALQSHQWTDEERQDARLSLDFSSAEALQLGSAYSLGFFIALLRYIAQPTDKFALNFVQLYYKQIMRIKAGELAHQDASASTEVPRLDEAINEELLDSLVYAGRRGLLELGELILHHFDRLFLTQEQAYIVYFLGLLQQWEQREGSDLISFLRYWDERGHSQTIEAPEDERLLRLMTIHKSKGLDFPAVLLPDLAWPLFGNKQDSTMLWCSLDRSQLSTRLQKQLSSAHSDLPDMLPVRSSKALSGTPFATEYYRERFNNAYDTLNLLYVATTRPAQELHLWIASAAAEQSTKDEEDQEAPKKKAKKRAKEETSIEHMEALLQELKLVDFCSNLFGTEGFAHSPAEAPDKYNIELPHYTAKHKEHSGSRSCRLTQLTAYPSSDRIAILREGLEHFKADSALRHGRVMHAILERIETSADIAAALDEAIREGLITEGQRSSVQARLEEITTHPDTTRWFDGSGSVRTEATIIGGQGNQVRRPDRILSYQTEHGLHIEIIDYKFGSPKASYHKQVQRYMALLRAMGYSDVAGYLCYIHEQDIELVSVTPS